MAKRPNVRNGASEPQSRTSAGRLERANAGSGSRDTRGDARKTRNNENIWSQRQEEGDELLERANNSVANAEAMKWKT
ncbi:hypothetical protein R1flu_000315 [Riccia fluitans]|uniref:Uncharacterized protein n=1 Tax=Riccia fluitans TaxID=41844 RepID=A0ABD1Y056_9MARC